MFLIFQVLVNSCPGAIGVLSGMLTSTVSGSHEYLSHNATTVPSAFVTCATGRVVTVAVAWGSAVSAGMLEGAAVVGGAGVNTAAVNVNSDTTVRAADVRTAAT